MKRERKEVVTKVVSNGCLNITTHKNISFITVDVI